METAVDDPRLLREIAAMLSEDGYTLTARVLRDVARRIESPDPVRPRPKAPRRAALRTR